MKNVLFTLFAIGLAAVAAIAATTAMLNTPLPRSAATAQHIGPPAQDKKPDGTAPPGTTAPAPSEDRPTPAPIPDADRPAPGGAGKPAEPGSQAPAPGGARPAPEAGAEGEEDKADADPYEGIAPEDLPPDLQYDADASVSFPTNT